MDKAFAAFIVATGASFALYRLTFDIQPVLAPPPTVKLVLASHDLEPGTIIQAGDLVLNDWLGQAGGQNLERHVASQPGIGGAPHFAHAALAQLRTRLSNFGRMMILISSA